MFVVPEQCTLSQAALSQRTGSGGPGASLSTQYPSLTTIRARGLEHSAFLVFLYFWMVAPNARQLWHCTFADLCRQHSSSGRFWCTDGVANKHSRALLVLDIILQHIPTPQGDDTTVLNAKIIMEAVMRPVSSDVLTTQLRRALQTSVEMLDTKHMVHCRDWDALLDTLRQVCSSQKEKEGP